MPRVSIKSFFEELQNSTIAVDVMESHRTISLSMKVR